MINLTEQQKEIVQAIIENLTKQGLSYNQAYNSIITTMKAFNLI